MKIKVRSKFTVVLSPRRSEALSRIPRSRRVIDGAAFSISSKSTIEMSLFSELTAFNLPWLSIG
jgi:hypothetical protein